MRHVLIADDHEITRRGIREILADSFDRIEIEEVGDGQSVLDRVLKRPWDLITIDILMPGPTIIELLRGIRLLSSTVPILVLTAAVEIEYTIQSMKAGANGVIQKHRAVDDLLMAIRAVSNGGAYLHPETAIAIASDLRNAGTSHLHDQLSTRELQIFRGIAEGKSIKELAAEVGLSDKTVTTYLTRIREKTGLRTHVDIARYALVNGLVK